MQVTGHLGFVANDHGTVTDTPYRLRYSLRGVTYFSANPRWLSWFRLLGRWTKIWQV